MGKDLSPHGCLPVWGSYRFLSLQTGEWENGIHLVGSQQFFIHRQMLYTLSRIYFLWSVNILFESCMYYYILREGRQKDCNGEASKML